jgi:prepilin-type N-terminal cleavage/methylation domain-containing protein
MRARNRRPAAFDRERGFTLLEALIATAILTLVALSGLAACKALAHTLSWSADAQAGSAALADQTAQFTSDAASALAVFVPATDMNGRPNAGQELDFYSTNFSGGPLLWRYVYDPAAQTLQRWDYDPGGARGVRDVKTGTIDPAAAYPALPGITRFSATSLTADGLGDPAHNVYSGIGGLFARPPRAQPVRYDMPAPNFPKVVGGNGVVQVALANRNAARLIHLAAGSLPTGFTVTGVPLWHAVVYRVDQSHRFLLGPASKSHVFINARVDVSYDGWATSKIAWCDFNLLGAPDGLEAHDPHADYKPDEPIERADAILAACRRRHPVPPVRGAADYPPDADAIHPPLAGQTAPPCWNRPGPAGRCWPADAPRDWAPPQALSPSESPPPQWCATHAASPACHAARSAPGVR